MRVIESTFGTKGIQVNARRPSSPLFASVLFARAVQADWGDFDNQNAVPRCVEPACRRDPIQSRCQRRRLARVHLCKGPVVASAVDTLPISIALRILWMGVPVGAPVVRVALKPSALGITLVALIVRVGFQLVPMPLALSGALAFWQWAVGLVRGLRARLESLAAACAALGRHQFSPYEKRMETMRDGGKVRPPGSAFRLANALYWRQRQERN